MLMEPTLGRERSLSRPEDNQDVLDDEIKLLFHQDNVIDADTLMAREMATLSVNDHEAIYYVSDGVDESKLLIKESLEKMDDMLFTLDMDKGAYMTATSQDALYVQNPKLRLRFLRADRFNAKAAAKRFILHFQIKLELFGVGLLTKHICQDDLDPQDLAALYNAALYFLPVKDAAGRPVIICKSQSSDFPPQSILRKCFYIAMTCTDDEESQRKGCVFISYLIGQKLAFPEVSQRREVNRRYAEVMAGCPLRVETMHFCIDTFYWRPFIAIFKLAASMFTRLRCREHYGTHNQVLFSLQTFGIPLEFVESSIFSTG